MYLRKYKISKAAFLENTSQQPSLYIIWFRVSPKQKYYFMSETYLKPSQTSTILEIHLGSQQLPRVLPRQNRVFIVITSVKILPRWLFPRKICIQYTIFNTYFSTKLLFPTKRYHLQVLEKSLYVIQEVKSTIYFRQFIHPLSLCSRGNGTSFPFTL